MTTIKEWLNANVWDGEDRSGCKTDSAAFSPDELLELVTDCIAATQPQWVSVEERLPEIKDDAVLVYFDKYDGIELVHIQDYFADITAGVDAEGEQLYTKWYLTVGVTHWMPLPPEPEK